jgi:hypothetical protein
MSKSKSNHGFDHLMIHFSSQYSYIFYLKIPEKIKQINIPTKYTSNAPTLNAPKSPESDKRFSPSHSNPNPTAAKNKGRGAAAAEEEAALLGAAPSALT